MKRFFIFVLGGILFCATVNLHAAMKPFYSFTADGAGVSVDAVGLRDNTQGFLQADIPVGATVEKAFLYSASVWSRSLADVEFEGSTLISSPSSRLDVALKNSNPASENRWDVTSLVQTKVGGGSGLFDFSVKELGYLDGEILAVVYSILNQPTKTAIIFDGELATTGDTFDIQLSPPFEVGDDVIMSLGISYGYQGTDQYTRVDVNGQRLTSSAGGQDDGYGANGGLITAGGVGDSIANPPNPFAGPNNDPTYDDELYNLGSFLASGDMLITIDTLNPSNDDNVFFMALTAEGKAQTHVVPIPGAVWFLGSGLFGLLGLRKKLRV